MLCWGSSSCCPRLFFFGAAAIGVWNASIVVRGPRQAVRERPGPCVLALALLVVLWVALAFHLIAFDVNY